MGLGNARPATTSDAILGNPLEPTPSIQPASDLGPVHTLAARNQWPWLPTRPGGPHLPHPYCGGCGLVKFVGAGRALDMGGLVNWLARLQRRLNELGLRMTEAQQRLIVLRLEAQEAGDSFGLSRESQMNLLSEAVGTYLRLPSEVVASFLRSA